MSFLLKLLGLDKTPASKTERSTHETVEAKKNSPANPSASVSSAASSVRQVDNEVKEPRGSNTGASVPGHTVHSKERIQADLERAKHLRSRHLIDAIKSGQVNESERILSEGIDPNVFDDSGYNPLMYCAQKGWVYLARLLIQAGADPYLTNEVGISAIKMAEDSRHQPMLELFSTVQAPVPEDGKRTTSSGTSRSSAVHPAYEEENAYLKKTQSTIAQVIQSHKRSSHNGFGAGDAYAESILRNRYAGTIRRLEEAYDSPFFGRYDFHSDAGQGSKIYIGRMGIESYVTNWEAPAANVFYKKELGPVTCSLGTGVVTLIRQMTIHSGTLVRIHDSNWVEHQKQDYFDPILYERLQQNTGDSLKDIVETIQPEQNEIIRADKTVPLIIQGSAGSGKTTIAIHRLAYLLRMHPHMTPQRVIIFGPNKMFLQYIQNVLPALGVTDVQQTTFEEWALDLLKLKGHPIRYRSFYDSIHPKNRSDNQRLEWIAKLKGSFEFSGWVLASLKSWIDRKFRPPCTIEAHTSFGTFRIPQTEMSKWFQEDYRYSPYAKRREQIIRRIENRYDSFMKALEEETGEQAARDQSFTEALSEFKTLWRAVTAYDVYCDILSGPGAADDLAQLFQLNGEEASFFTLRAEEMAGKREVEFDDLAVLLQIHKVLYGDPAKYQYVIVDEAQDFSAMQIRCVEETAEEGSLMLLGDLGQSIFSFRGIERWDELKLQIKPEYYELSTSYRSTIPITRLANRIIEPWSRGRYTTSLPVLRNGEEPVIRRFTDDAGIAEAIFSLKDKWIERKRVNIAIIARHLDTLVRLREIMPPNARGEVISDPSATYEGGMVWIPTYLAKGLEFDAVVVVDASSYQYESEDDLAQRFLYVAATRALHELFLFYKGSPYPALIS
ncbi:UvrD-helicase domain-containing protein [Paenibacillus vulneris]|uniref:UvrD-helicase domain-containing protein n=1 Tax=Paenibacillus vulneris TaxID=1133364 RepID=A0ABW3UYQ3_9BACL